MCLTVYLQTEPPDSRTLLRSRSVRRRELATKERGREILSGIATATLFVSSILSLCLVHRIAVVRREDDRRLWEALRISGMVYILLKHNRPHREYKSSYPVQILSQQALSLVPAMHWERQPLARL